MSASHCCVHMDQATTWGTDNKTHYAAIRYDANGERYYIGAVKEPLAWCPWCGSFLLLGGVDDAG